MAIQPIDIGSISSIEPGPIAGAGEDVAGLGGQADGRGFGAMLAGLSGVEAGGNRAITDLAVDANRDLHDVVLAVEMESIAFDLAVQIRNRMVDAYQEIFRMNI